MSKILFIPYKLALIAYEKGLKIAGYEADLYFKRRSNGEIHGLDINYIETNQNMAQWDNLEERTEAITYDQIIDWFEKNKIIILPNYDSSRIIKKWSYHIIEIGASDKIISGGMSYTKYEMLDKAIEKAFLLIGAEKTKIEIKTIDSKIKELFELSDRFIFPEFYTHTNKPMWKIENIYTKYREEIIVLCEVEKGIECALDMAIDQI